MLSSSFSLVYSKLFVVSAAFSFAFHLSRLAECLRKLGCRHSDKGEGGGHALGCAGSCRAAGQESVMACCKDRMEGTGGRDLVP